MTKTALSLRADIQDKALVRSFSYVGGKWSAASNGETIRVTDPATGDVIGDVASLSADNSVTAVDAAQAAFPAWSGLLPQQRSAILRRMLPDIAHNPAVEHLDETPRMAHDALIVRGNDEGRPVPPIKLLEELDEFVRSYGIQVGRRFVRKNQVRT